MAVASYKFADFELDSARFELRRNDRVLKVERIPLELLILLAEKDGSVVSRQEIVDRLWGKDVFVDTEHGINTAIRKVRQALKDDPEHPRFVQTVTGKGYRFVAEKNGHAEPAEPMERRTSRPLSVPEVSGRSLAITDAAEIKPAPLASRKKMAAAIALFLAAIAGLAFEFRARLLPTPASQIHSIAVLPLLNLSGDAAQDYFADGMTDELITALAKNRNLRVVSRTSAMQYKGVQRPVRDIARELGVDGILEGSIERTPNKVHMTVQLIYAPTDSHVWAESYDHDVNQAYTIPEELASTVAKEVKAATSPAPPARYINPEAHDFYLRGRYFWLSFDTDESIRLFQKAIDLQQDYAAAWSGLSDSYAFAIFHEDAPPQPLLEKAIAAAHKAVELDNSLPEAHHSMASTEFLSWNVTQAEAEIRHVIELGPNLAEGHYLHYKILLAENRKDAALQEAKLATQLDPFSRAWGLGSAYFCVGQYDAAMREFQLQVQAHPSDADLRLFLSQAYWVKGMYDEAEASYEKYLQLSGNPKEADTIHRIYGRGGEQAVARHNVEETKARARKEYVSPLTLAEAFSRTRDKDETLKYLETAFSERTPTLVWIQTDWHYDFLRSDPRYQAIVRKMGQPLFP